MLKVSVPAVQTRTITSKAGKQFVLQTIYLHTFARDGKPNMFPEKTEVFLDTDQAGQPKVYQAGDYQLHPSSFYVDQRGNIAVAARLASIPKQ
jgi:hypothetical protein